MIFVLFPIKLRFFKNKSFIEQRRHSKHITDGEYMCDKISCLRSYFYNFLALLQESAPETAGMQSRAGTLAKKTLKISFSRSV
jgi:hypothetical protein